MSQPTTAAPERPRHFLSRCLAAAMVVMAVLASVALAHPFAVRLRAPADVVAGSQFTVELSGYFNCTMKNLRSYSCANIAMLSEVKGMVRCSHKAITGPDAREIDSFYRDPRLREGHPRSGVSVSKPGPFSASISVAAPSAGSYTLCAPLMNFPVGRFLKWATAHFTVH